VNEKEPLSVLVVDDSEEFCRNVKDILELQDFRVDIATDGFQALKIVSQKGFDLVLMDVKMPVMSGVETFKKMKGIIPGVPIIMMTAYAVEDLIREALREGAFGCMSKPLDFEMLFDVIEDARHQGGLLLVVDDDRELTGTMTEVLTKKGFRVSVANDGNVAREKAYLGDFDVILVDLKLPPLNGLETYLEIQDIRPDIVAIIITGYMNEMGSLVSQAMKENAYACLEKPIDMDRLLTILGHIQQRRAPGNSHTP
jgi:two-component system response regulator HydG